MPFCLYRELRALQQQQRQLKADANIISRRNNLMPHYREKRGAVSGKVIPIQEATSLFQYKDRLDPSIGIPIIKITVMRPSYLYKGNVCTKKMTTVYWNNTQTCLETNEWNSLQLIFHKILIRCTIFMFSLEKKNIIGIAHILYTQKAFAKYLGITAYLTVQNACFWVSCPITVVKFMLNYYLW